MIDEITKKMIEQLMLELQEKQKIIDGMRKEISGLHGYIAELESHQEDDDEKPQYLSLNDPVKSRL